VGGAGLKMVIFIRGKFFSRRLIKEHVLITFSMPMGARELAPIKFTTRVKASMY